MSELNIPRFESRSGHYSAIRLDRIVTGPTRPSSLEAGSYSGYQAELNIKARPGRVSSLGAGVTMQQIPERYENS